MANQEQLDLLQQGVAESWNRWRLVHSDRLLDLDEADMSEFHLGGFNLSKAHLSGTDLTRADGNNADLRYAILIGANLSGTNLWLPRRKGPCQPSPREASMWRKTSRFYF